MTQPLDAVLAFHNAFRNDIKRIDDAANEAAQGKKGSEKELGRYYFFNEMLVWHAHGEELGIFPEVDRVAPLVAEAYLRDHHGLDEAYDAMHSAIKAGDLLETARTSAAFKFHLDIHLAKEDAHLYRIMRERTTLPEQGKAVGIMASTVPPERFTDVINWIIPLTGPDDQENMVRIWQMVLPPERFPMVVNLVQQAAGDDWMELVRRIPELQ